MGFSAIPARPETSILIPTLELWTRRADAGLVKGKTVGIDATTLDGRGVEKATQRALVLRHSPFLSTPPIFTRRAQKHESPPASGQFL